MRADANTKCNLCAKPEVLGQIQISNIFKYELIKGSMFKRGKRGISPLIATVLLIAFAVAIGVMLINIGGKAKKVGDCTEVKIELQTINSKPLLCYDTLNTKLTFMIKNTGSVDIDKIKLLATGEDYSHDEKIIDDSSLTSGSLITKTIDYVKSGKFKIELVPMITYGGKEASCLDKSVAVETIDKCN